MNKIDKTIEELKSEYELQKASVGCEVSLSEAIRKALQDHEANIREEIVKEIEGMIIVSRDEDDQFQMHCDGWNNACEEIISEIKQ